MIIDYSRPSAVQNVHFPVQEFPCEVRQDDKERKAEGGHRSKSDSRDNTDYGNYP